ncbi:MAG: DUF3488 domain-containing protein [Kiritimatiellae bacterium]|nr:DUF3488 domain-containing protein [Kiritimatiellia bacterium]
MFILAPHLLFLLAILGVGLTLDSAALTGLLAGAFVIGLYATHVRGRSMARRTETALAFAALPAAVLYAQLAGEHVLLAIRHWLALMLVLRAYRKMEKRDYAFCFLIAAALFVYVGKTYDSPLFLLLTLANLVLTPYALFYFLAYYGGFQQTDRVRRPAHVRFTAHQFRFMTGISGILVVATVLLFLILPRPLTGTMLGAALRDRQGVTGFADDVPLGSFDEIVEQADIVMMVQTDKPALWRSRVFDCYQGGIWRETAGFHWRRPREAPVVEPDVPRVTRRFELFDVQLTNFRLPAAGHLLSARALNGVWQIWINDFYSTLLIRRAWVREFHGTYEVVSQDTEFIGPKHLSLSDKRRWRLPVEGGGWIREADIFLQLPPDLPRRVREEALRMTQGAPTIEAKVRAVERYLATGFVYSLEDLDSGALAPLEYFLFESRRGHCEYFATAMAILLRCADVRTRVVQGFAPGTFVDDRYVVRLSDAHLWTEVFYPGRGWKAYDPSPGREARTQTRRTVGFWEKLRLKWDTYVLQYDGLVRAQLLDRIRQASGRLARRAVRGLVRFARPMLGLVALGALLVWIRLRGLPALPIGWFRPGRGSRAAVHHVRSTFGRYLKELARKGYRRAPGTTPNDLVLALEQDHVPILDDARFLTRVFYRTRFGGAQPSAEGEQRLREALARIRRWAR